MIAAIIFMCIVFGLAMAIEIALSPTIEEDKESFCTTPEQQPIECEKWFQCSDCPNYNPICKN